MKYLVFDTKLYIPRVSIVYDTKKEADETALTMAKENGRTAEIYEYHPRKGDKLIACTQIDKNGKIYIAAACDLNLKF